MVEQLYQARRAGLEDWVTAVAQPRRIHAQAGSPGVEPVPQLSSRRTRICWLVLLSMSTGRCSCLSANRSRVVRRASPAEREGAAVSGDRPEAIRRCVGHGHAPLPCVDLVDDQVPQSRRIKGAAKALRIGLTGRHT